MDNYKKVLMNRKQIIINNFIGGIAWGLGATIGLAIVLIVLGFVVGKIDFIPFIGDFLSNVNEYTQKNPRLIK